MLIPRKLPNGSTAWLDPEVDDFVRRLTELDPRLALVRHDDGSWSIWRVAEDGSEHIIARSKPFAKLNQGVIDRLQAGSLVARGNDPIGRMIEHNDRVQREAEAKAEEQYEEFLDTLYRKAWRGRIPNGYTNFSPKPRKT